MTVLFPIGGASVRLQKYLAQAGVASRRKAEELITQGRVSVNGFIVTQLGTAVSPGDQVSVDGQAITGGETHVYLLLNKPAGVLSTVTDTHSRQTVLDLLPAPWANYRIFPVGRLDMDTEGLLLLTNDGDFTFQLTHPRFHVPKTYLALVRGRVTRQTVSLLERGVPLDDGMSLPAKVRLIKSDGRVSLLEMVLYEGRKRQVKRMCSYVGHRVKKLVRTAFGPLNLQGLPVGEIRLLTAAEIQQLLSLAQEGEKHVQNQRNPRSDNGRV